MAETAARRSGETNEMANEITVLKGMLTGHDPALTGCEELVLVGDERRAIQAAIELIESMARLTKDGECAACGTDGYDDNPECEGHEAFDMPNDDAVDTLHDLINQARDLNRKEVAR